MSTVFDDTQPDSPDAAGDAQASETLRQVKDQIAASAVLRARTLRSRCLPHLGR